MAGLRFFSLLITRNSCLTQNNNLSGKRFLFLSAHLSARASKRRGNGPVEKPYSAPIIDLETQTYEIQEPAYVNHEPQNHESKPDPSCKSSIVVKEVKHPLPFRFVRLDKNDHRLSDVMLTVKSKKHRQQANLIMLEGKRLINDALSAGVRPHCFFFSRASDFVDISVPTGDDAVPVYKTTYKELKLWSDVVTCPGIIGIFNTPSPNVVEPPEEAMPLKIICDNVRDPGNLGSILRVAAGVGSSKVILTKGCCDMWDTKVLRASAGAHFRIPIDTGIEWKDMSKHVDMGEHVFIADNHDDLQLNHKNFLSEKTQGNEKQWSDSDSDSDSDEEVEHKLSKGDYELDLLKEELSNSLPYFEINFVERSPMVLIIGGETHGVSLSALQFSRFQSSCTRLNIPLFNSVESLNNSIALSVIAYEMQRQFIMNYNMSSSSGMPQDHEHHSANSQT